jgi:succinyl-CoA synthetase alpha subunit
MSILIGRETRLVVHGITGREGEFHSRSMLEYGTPIVAGMTPGKGGQRALDGRVPVFDTVAEAVRETGANTSCIFVPAAGAPDAILEAVAAGIATIFCITEGIPALDMIPVVETVRAAGARLIGPNCPGATSPGQVKVGIIPGSIHRGDRPVDLRRDRWRPDHRDHVHRRPPAVRRRSRDRRHRPHRRDRRGG